MSYQLYVNRLCENCCRKRWFSFHCALNPVFSSLVQEPGIPAPSPIQVARDREQGDRKTTESKINIPSTSSGHRPSTLRPFDGLRAAQAQGGVNLLQALQPSQPFQLSQPIFLAQSDFFSSFSSAGLPGLRSKL